MKKLTRIGAVAGAAAFAVVAGPLSPASAVDGWVDVTRYSPNGGGARAKAYVNFTSSTRVQWDDIYLNDFCNNAGEGDGHRALLRFKVRYEGDSGWTTVGERADTGGCTSAPYTESTASWSTSSRRINDATVVACVEDLGCTAASDEYRDNPHW